MSSPSLPTTAYVVDTSALMDWHDRFYPPDVFPSLVAHIDALLTAGRLRSPEMVRDEINSIGSNALQVWVKARPTLFDPTANHLAQALSVEGQFPALKDPRAQYDEADAYVIAVVQMLGAIVISAETPASHKRKPRRAMYVPDVCGQLGIACITNLGMMRREGWKL